MNESSMARFLGLAPKAKRIGLTPGLTVVMTVRRNNFGPVERFVHPTQTLSRLEAEIEATKEARKKGLTFHALLDIAPPDQVQVSFAM